MQLTPYKIYSASAGSGKTFTLVKAYLEIILAPGFSNNFRQLLAITFTNKAVGEMKQRILGSLYEFSQDREVGNPSPLFRSLLRELRLSPEELQRKSWKTLKQILHNYAFFDVSTIDKFTHRLIRTFAKDLKLPQNFEVVLDTDLLLDEAVSRLISKAGTDKELTGVLIEFALEKIDESKSWDLSFDLNKVGKLLFNENHLPHLQSLLTRNIPDFLAFRGEIKTRTTARKEEIIRASGDILSIIETNHLEYNNFKGSYFPKFIHKLSLGDLDINFKAAWKQNFDSEPLYNKSCPEEIKSRLDSLHQEFNSLFQQIKSSWYQRALLQNIYDNLVPLTILNSMQQELLALQAERNQLPITSFNVIISDEIKNQPAPFIYERIGEKYRHYFIDEFQDTSEMQWKNLIPLISNALESEDEQGEKGSLLLVGDAKQAIYRWRGGRAEQFLNLLSLSGQPFVIAPEIMDLPVNYRSGKEIVNFNNSFFTTTSSSLYSDEYRSLFVEGNKQNYHTNEGGFVEMSFLDKDDKQTMDEQYCKKVLQSIRAAMDCAYEYGDICILTRKRSQGVTLSDFLMHHNIPLVSAETLLLKSNQKVAFLISLLRYCTHPLDLENVYDILYFLEVDSAKKHRFIQENIEILNEAISESFGFEFGHLKKLSVYDGLEYAIAQFNLATSSDAYLTFLLDEALQVEQREDSSISTFLDYWEKNQDKLSIVAPETINAVRIMTVHKAKGLEFPCVIFPYANTHIYNEIDPKLWLPLNMPDRYGFKEVLISKKQEVVHYSKQAQLLYEEEQHKLELDAFNLLYVALTRAVSSLYIITEMDLNSDGAPKPAYYSGLFIQYLIEQGLWAEGRSTYTFGTLLPKESLKKTMMPENSVPFLYSQKDRPEFRILTTSGMLWDTEREEALSRGTIVHRLMELVISREDINLALERLKSKGVIEESEEGQYRKIAEDIVDHPKLRSFYRNELDIKNEREIISENGLILRPDRLVIDGKKVTIIDYKTGRQDSKYSEQLYAYSDALVAMGYLVEHKVIVYINKGIQPVFI